MKSQLSPPLFFTETYVNDAVDVFISGGLMPTNHTSISDIELCLTWIVSRHVFETVYTLFVRS